MLRSNTYTMLKNQILGGRYEKEDMLYRLDVFYARNRIDMEQYTELADIVKAGIGKN